MLPPQLLGTLAIIWVVLGIIAAVKAYDADHDIFGHHWTHRIILIPLGICLWPLLRTLPAADEMEPEDDEVDPDAVFTCPHCQRKHKHMMFVKQVPQVPGWSHWSICPKTGKMITLKLKHDAPTEVPPGNENITKAGQLYLLAFTCPRCREVHRGMRFDHINRPDTAHNFFATCPKLSQPITLRFVPHVYSEDVPGKLTIGEVQGRGTRPAARDDLKTLARVPQGKRGRKTMLIPDDWWDADWPNWPARQSEPVQSPSSPG